MDNGFRALKVTRQFVDALHKMGIDEPTDIQKKAITPALAGQDVLGIAQTGSGKTLAYLLPLVLKIKFAQGPAPRALVLAPSKELVIQIFRVLKELTVFTDIQSVCLYGGVGKKQQITNLTTGADILVSTPGRFIDLYSDGHIITRNLKTLVLDEADRMMEMGFLPQLRQILEVIRVKRQNLLFSATFPERVERMAEEFLEFPTRVESENIEKPVEQVVQQWYAVPNFRTKLNLLKHLLKSEKKDRVIVFCRTKDAAERSYRWLERQNVGEVRVLHGNKAQNTRINALDDFKNGIVRILVTTDVTSRGIDVEDVSHVFNFELPKSPRDYLHRIGRTARINKEGVAIAFANEAEKFYLSDIEKYTKTKITEVSLPKEVAIAEFLPNEKQNIARAIDAYKRKADPTFKGSFHERTKKATPAKRRTGRKTSKSRRRRRKR